MTRIEDEWDLRPAEEINLEQQLAAKALDELISDFCIENVDVIVSGLCNQLDLVGDEVYNILKNALLGAYKGGKAVQ